MLNSRLGYWLPRVALLAVLVALLVGVWLGRPARFDPAVWYANSEPESFSTQRFRMTQDLIKNHLTVGMPRTQSRNLLGVPDASSQITFDAYGHPVVNDTDAYSLGFVGNAKDITTLELRYSHSGVLLKAEIVER